jgi:hypothetical protein
MSFSPYSTVYSFNDSALEIALNVFLVYKLSALMLYSILSSFKPSINYNIISSQPCIECLKRSNSEGRLFV